jgi:CHAT domain-containing protein
MIVAGGAIGRIHGFMCAGAKRIVIHLWGVDDAQTANLMSDFYQQIMADGQNAHATCRQAQLAMWNSDTQYRAPYYWAAFTIQGEWSED